MTNPKHTIVKVFLNEKKDYEIPDFIVPFEEWEKWKEVSAAEELPEETYEYEISTPGTLYFIASAYGFFTGKTAYYTSDIREAYPFESWTEADLTAKNRLKLDYYAILNNGI